MTALAVLLLIALAAFLGDVVGAHYHDRVARRRHADQLRKVEEHQEADRRREVEHRRALAAHQFDVQRRIQESMLEHHERLREVWREDEGEEWKG